MELICFHPPWPVPQASSTEHLLTLTEGRRGQKIQLSGPQMALSSGHRILSGRHEAISSTRSPVMPTYGPQFNRVTFRNDWETFQAENDPTKADRGPLGPTGHSLVPMGPFPTDWGPLSPTEDLHKPKNYPLPDRQARISQPDRVPFQSDIGTTRVRHFSTFLISPRVPPILVRFSRFIVA